MNELGASVIAAVGGLIVSAARPVRVAAAIQTSTGTASAIAGKRTASAVSRQPRRRDLSRPASTANATAGMSAYEVSLVRIASAVTEHSAIASRRGAPRRTTRAPSHSTNVHDVMRSASGVTLVEMYGTIG